MFFQSMMDMMMRLLRNYLICLLALCLPTLLSATDSLCAVVKIRIEQTLSLERQAFDAALVINNAQATPLRQVNIDVVFKDADGNAVVATSDSNNTNAKFYLRPNDMTGVSGNNVNGTGEIAGNSEAEIHWLIIPSPGASGNAVDGKLYYVGAKMTYQQGGVSKVMSIGADTITVKPTPKLGLDYFITKDVYADNPLTTTVVEKAEPFKLGVLVSNTGIAAANRVSIKSAQPKIIENQQDLLIDFSIIGSKVNGQAVNTGLMANFGHIPAGGVASGYWIMKTTLAGTFTDIVAKVSHAENLGGQLTALLTSDAITSHLLAGYVINNSAGEDDVNDFLADDGTAAQPVYRLYESDGDQSPVKDLSNRATLTYDRRSGNYLYYKLTLPSHEGLLFIDLKNPTDNRYALTRTTAGGARLPDDNAWTQFVRQTQNGKTAFVSRLRLFDIRSAGEYELAFNVNRNKPQAPVILKDGWLDGVSVTTGETIKLTIRAIDVNDDEISLVIKNLPKGASWTMTTNERGEVVYQLIWQPSQAGDYQLTLEAFDGNLTSTETITLSVKDKVMPAAWMLYDSFEE